MATLAKLKTMNDREIQNWLKKVDKIDAVALIYALLGADEEVKNCILRNMSGQAANSLKTNLVKYDKMNVAASTINKNSTKLVKLM